MLYLTIATTHWIYGSVLAFANGLCGFFMFKNSGKG